MKADIRAVESKSEQVRGEIHKAKFEMVIWLGGLLLASGLIHHFFK